MIRFNPLLWTKHGLATATAICCLVLLLTSETQAQFLGGDFRNTTLNIGEGMGGDVALNVQTGDDGKPQVTGGVTVKPGDKVSFDERGVLKTQTAGFWKGEAGKKYRVLFRDTKGDKFAIVELQGEVRWNSDRNVSKGSENLLQIMTVAAPDKWEKITKTDITDGKLRLVTQSGVSFVVYSLSCDFSGTIEKKTQK